MYALADHIVSPSLPPFSMSNLEQVIREATSKRHPAVPAGELREIKQACRLSPENVSLAFQLLLTRLREPNLQVWC